MICQVVMMLKLPFAATPVSSGSFTGVGVEVAVTASVDVPPEPFVVVEVSSPDVAAVAAVGSGAVDLVGVAASVTVVPVPPDEFSDPEAVPFAAAFPHPASMRTVNPTAAILYNLLLIVFSSLSYVFMIKPDQALFFRKWLFCKLSVTIPLSFKIFKSHHLNYIV